MGYGRYSLWSGDNTNRYTNWSGKRDMIMSYDSGTTSIYFIPENEDGSWDNSRLIQRDISGGGIEKVKALAWAFGTRWRTKAVHTFHADEDDPKECGYPCIIVDIPKEDWK